MNSAPAAAAKNTKSVTWPQTWRGKHHRHSRYNPLPPKPTAPAKKLNTENNDDRVKPTNNWRNFHFQIELENYGDRASLYLHNLTIPYEFGLPQERFINHPHQAIQRC